MVDFVSLIAFLAIGGLLIFFGYSAKKYAPYKPNKIIMVIGSVFVFLGVGLFVVIPILVSQPMAQSEGDSASYIYVENPGEVVLMGSVTGKVTPCKKDFCFNVEVFSVIRGTLDKGNVLVKTNKNLEFYQSNIQLEGINKGDYVYANSSKIIEIFPIGESQ